MEKQKEVLIMKDNKNRLAKTTVCALTPEASAVIERMKIEAKEGYRFSAKDAISALIVREWGKK